MAIASWMIRGRSLRSGRFNRGRHDADDENVQLDLSKDPKENVQEIFNHVCQRQGVVEGKRLGYLNAFVKLVSQPGINHAQLGYSKEELLCCLRTSLIHEATQVRAAGLRAIRYLLEDENDIRILIQLQIPSLIARSLDLTLRNDLERIQSIRIMRRILAISPSHFPVSLLRCLISLANGAAEANDRMLRASLAVLCEICVLNPLSFIKCGGITPMIRNILECGLPRVSESLVGCLLFLLDRPETRAAARLDLQCFAEPYCDLYFRKGTVTNPDKAKAEREIRERELRLYSSHVALLSILRSWPGLLQFCNPAGNSGLQALVDVLYLKQLEVRKAVLDLLYDLLGIPLPEWTDELSVALDAVDPSHPQDSWRLSEGFVAAEGRSVLSHLAKFRPNIVVNHLSALLQAFLNAGLLAAIVEVIVAEDTFLSVRATILLGQLLHMIHVLLPPECCNITPPLPSLMWYAVGASPLDHPPSTAQHKSSAKQTYQKILASVQPALTVTKANQQQAQASVAAMNQLHRLLKRRPAPASLFLAQILNSSSRFHAEARKAAREESQSSDTTGNQSRNTSVKSGGSRRRRRFSESVLSIASRGRYSKSKLQQMLAKESEDALKESLVLTNKDGFSWNWEIVRSILKSKSDTLLKLEDSNHRTFVKRLVHFYKPSSNRFSQVELGGNRKQKNTYTLAGIELFDALLQAEEVEGSRLTGELLEDIYSQIEEILSSKTAHDCLFSPQHVNNSLCQDYFLFIGHLCQSRGGLHILESSGLLSLLHRLVTNTNHDCYIKLVVSSLDYAVCGEPRQILETVLKSGSDSSRLYATQFLVVLLRARVPNFHEWGIPLIVNQVRDKSKSVRLAALNILDEACDENIFLQSLAEIQPTFNSDIERELLIEIRLASVPCGFSKLQQTGFLSSQMDFWATEYNYRYVRFVEGEIHDALSLHQRGEDGHYNRRVSSAKHIVKDVFVPPHLYGQLTQLPQGRKLLFHDPRVQSLLKTVKDQQCTSDQEILELKAALWAVSHIATSSSGLEWVANEGVIHSIVNLAQSCLVYSLRSTAFYCIGLVSTTAPGADFLSVLGWVSVRHHRHERWPVIHQNLHSTRFIPVKEDITTQTLFLADETETESSVVTEEDDSSLWDDSFSNNGVQFWNETSPGDPPSRRARTLPHQRAPPEWTRKQQRSLSESQSGSPQLQQLAGSPESSFLTSSSTGTVGAETSAVATSGDVPSLANPPKYTDDMKSRSNSCSDSGVCSYDSTGGKQTNDRIQTLSPIPSSTSLNTLKSATLSCVPTPLVTPVTVLQQEDRVRRTSFQGSIISDHLSPTHSALSSRLSQQDVAGYATLRSLQHQQRPQLPNLSSNLNHSFNATDNFFDDLTVLSSSSLTRERQSSSLLSSMRRLKVRSLDRQSTHPAFTNFDSKITDEIFAESPTASSSPNKSGISNTTKDSNQCYIGVSLPLSSCSIFPSKPNTSGKISLDTNGALSLNVDYDNSEAAKEENKRGTSASTSEVDCAQETDLAQNVHLFTESEDEVESEEGVWKGPDRDRGAGRASRRSAQSVVSQKGPRARRRRERASGVTYSYTEVRPYVHQAASCLACSWKAGQPLAVTQRERKISAGSYHARARTETESSCGTAEGNESPSRQRTISGGAFGESLESTTSTETVGSVHDNLSGTKNKAVVRSEVMRHVECMSNPIWIKPCQQSLLHSKQKHPQMLDDICLYSDLCESLASSNYRLQARRFLQELFLDVSFYEIYEEAVNILKLSTVGSDSSHSRSISVSLPPGEGLIMTGNVKIIENQMPPPLSMVLEELSGSEGRRGSNCSVAPGSIPKLSEVGPSRTQSTVKANFNTTNRISAPAELERHDAKNVNSEETSSDSHPNYPGKSMFESMSTSDNCPVNTRSCEVLNHSDSTVSDVNFSNDQRVNACQPVKKTVFSLLSQIDGASSRKKNDSENCQRSNLGESEVTKVIEVVPDSEEPSCPIRLLTNCRLQSTDGSDIRHLSSESTSD
ncbi:Rapamycin-insensitive companion of mTOR [Frankliniella fusca]|uniref:Rapamycin-insensitive companion of mTOR n=1 Tax=Frankliniella fusca TaxID=407009 RepID=A0AAE1HV08_9NEOP|nr:Rapamycin-insensitive companion of mTOR [Frankliniella fusca]